MRNKILRIILILLATIQFISIFFSNIPFFTAFCFLVSFYFLFSASYTILRHKYFIVRGDNTEETCLSSYKIFSFKKIAEKSIQFGLFQYKLLGVRNDVYINNSIGGSITFNPEIDAEQFPLFVNFDIVVSLVDPEIFTIKSRSSRPRLIRNIFSKFHFHTKRIEENNGLVDVDDYNILSLRIPYQSSNIYYKFTMHSIYENNLCKKETDKIKNAIKDYVRSEKFLKDEFNYSRN